MKNAYPLVQQSIRFLERPARSRPQCPWPQPDQRCPSAPSLAGQIGDGSLEHRFKRGAQNRRFGWLRAPYPRNLPTPILFRIASAMMERTPSVARGGAAGHVVPGYERAHELAVHLLGHCQPRSSCAGSAIEPCRAMPAGLNPAAFGLYSTLLQRTRGGTAAHFGRALL